MTLSVPIRKVSLYILSIIAKLYSVVVLTSKMTDEDFWVQFFQSQKFHRNRLPHKDSGSGLSGGGLFQECLSEDANGNLLNNNIIINFNIEFV